MEIVPLKISDLKLITPKRHRDERGIFCEIYNEKLFFAAGITAHFVQDNHSISLQKGTVRGLHFQRGSAAQGKLVRVLRGSILDIAVDIRPHSPTYGEHCAVTLTAENWQQLWIPEGFAHGFCTLENNCEVSYKVTSHYSKKHDAGIYWNDLSLAIDWPVDKNSALVSIKDKALPHLASLN